MDYSQIPVKVVHLNTVDSTNNYIAKLVQMNNVDSGTVVLADFQTAGRGQRGTNWQSVSGENMIASLYVEWTTLDLAHQFRISMYVALGICKFLRAHNVEAMIKWPNDILVHSKKICGVLIENQSRGNLISSSVIGIGLNVNQLDFPDGINGISLSNLTGKSENVKFVALQLFQCIGEVIQQYQHYSFEWLAKSYCGFLYGFEAYVKAWEVNENQELVFKITGVTPMGLLQIETAEGKSRLLDLKEVHFVL